MSITKVLITDMPGPAAWEFLMQWGALFTQAAAAVATVAAVYAALHIARSQERREREREEKIGDMTHAATVPALAPLLQNLGLIYQSVKVLKGSPEPEVASLAKRNIAVFSNDLSVVGVERVFEWLYTLDGDMGMRLANLIPMVPTLAKICVDIAASDKDELARLRYSHSLKMAEAHIGKIAISVLSILGVSQDEAWVASLKGAIDYWNAERAAV
ncbi:hypothetical protein LMG26842_05379 [Achromobacter dolens]|uniref:hypothetical protein n=1 Tax=Achromobacter dolens TaxID=1287738 RepID=UPI001466A49A|nr:hypothetical protein [Achromobacter dolens]CAB3901339.1 hypothetical protein LMG26842_05379 [Achromobacter dolens]